MKYWLIVYSETEKVTNRGLNITSAPVEGDIVEILKAFSTAYENDPCYTCVLSFQEITKEQFEALRGV